MFILAGITALFLQFIYFPKVMEVKKLSRENRKTRSDIAEIYNFIGGQENLRDNLIKARDYAAGLEKAFPYEREASNIIKQLNEEARAMKVNVISVKPGDLSRYTDTHGSQIKIFDYLCKGMPISLSVEARYQALGDFLHKIEYKRPMKKDNVIEFFSRLQAIEPEPKGELNYTNPFTLLVAVVLSAQATDIGVNKATEALFKAADTPEKMVALGEKKIRDYIKTIGLFNAKAKNVYKLSQILIDEHNSVVPQDRDALVMLPGVGRKTANVVLNMAFGQPTIAVDTHLFRVSNRTGLAGGKTVEAVEAKLEKKIPKEFLLHAHHWLILHGRYICKARKPDCPNCPVNDLCRFKSKTL